MRIPVSFVCTVTLFVLAMGATGLADDKAVGKLPKMTEVSITSSLDKTKQPSLLWAPDAATTKPAPLLVYLHSWSGDYRQNNSVWQKQAVDRGWIFLHPNFRGPNNQSQACGSRLARQDILDSVDFVISRYKVDQNRVYLAGSSGGGHMSMLMAGYYPQRFSAVSAWVGISDLAAWYRFQTKNGKPQRYAMMTAASCGGAPGSSKQVDEAYKARSPLFHLHNVGDLPLDIAAGVTDGHTGSVPIYQSLRAFNVIAKAHDDPRITEFEMHQLWDQERLNSGHSKV